jgi:hypothetical protein
MKMSHMDFVTLRKLLEDIVMAGGNRVMDIILG